MGRGRQLIRNFLVFALGTLGSKVVAIALLPLYTYHLSPSDFGVVDVALVAVDLIAAVAALGIHEAVLRYTMLNPESAGETLSSGAAVTVAAAVVVAAVGAVIAASSKAPVIPIFISTLVCLQLFQALFGRYARAVGRIGLFALSGLAQILVMGSFGVAFIAILGWGVNGYFLSVGAGIAASTAILMLFSGALRVLKPSEVHLSAVKAMAVFSLPLVPNAVMWWMISALGRYFILVSQGPAEVGLFSAASRIAAIITMITTVFAQAWQLSANDEFESVDRGHFYTETLARYQLAIFTAAGGLTAIIKPLIGLLVGPEFYLAWQYAPILILAAIFASLAAFLGTAYTAAFRTRGVLLTSMLGAVTTTVLYAALVPPIGATGASIASTIGFGIVWLIRLRGIQNIIPIANDWRTSASGLALLITQIAVLHIQLEQSLEVSVNLALLALFVLLRRRLSVEVLSQARGLYRLPRRPPE